MNRSDRQVWDAFWAAKNPEDIYPPVTDMALELKMVVPDLRGKKILEIGAGTGRTGIRLADLGAYVVLLDYSTNSLRLMQAQVQRGRAGVSLLLANALRAPLPDEAFDVVLHQGLLEHFRSPFELLRENVRLLKPGGHLLVDVPQSIHCYTLMKHGLMLAHRWFGGWERQFTVESLRRLVSAYGLDVVHAYGDWSRPGFCYKIVRMGVGRFGIRLPMYPTYWGGITERFYALQGRLRRKRLFLNTVLSVGVIARKRT